MSRRDELHGGAQRIARRRVALGLLLPQQLLHADAALLRNQLRLVLERLVQRHRRAYLLHHEQAARAEKLVDCCGTAREPNASVARF